MTRDPFSWLRSANPVTADQPVDEAGEELLASILTGKGERTPHRTRRVVVFVAAAAVATAAAAAAWIVSRPASDPIEVVCYHDGSLQADRSVTRLGADGALATCADLWNREHLGQGQPSPTLQACVLDSGVTAVLPGPGPQLCDQLGLARADASLNPEQRTLARVVDELTATFGPHCVPLVKAEAVAQAALDDAHLSRWRVVAAPPIPDAPCASLAIDIDTKTLQLVPISPPAGGS